MASIFTPLLPKPKTALPDHTQLPDNDGEPVRNVLAPLQSALLTDSLRPLLRQEFPEENYFIGQDQGIYWEHTDPPLKGCKAPDWFLVCDVPHLLHGLMRRSYVLWQEVVAPLVLLEYASDGGEEERDETPKHGKFWVYERRIRPAFYGIFLPEPGIIDMYHAVEDRLKPLAPNADGRFAIPALGVELGVWKGEYDGYDVNWMRWWDRVGRLLPTGDELAARENKRAEQERLRAEQERLRAEQERLRADQEQQRAEQEKQRAEQEKRRADALAAKLKALGHDPNEI